jgi:hypothetical protein
MATRRRIDEITKRIGNQMNRLKDKKKTLQHSIELIDAQIATLEFTSEEVSEIRTNCNYSD